MAITQPLSKLTLLEEQAVSITDYLGHGPWSCQTFYVDVSMKLKDDGISSRLLQQTEKKGQICLKVTSTGITTGTETWKWSYGSSLCSGCQQSPSKACKLEKHIKNCRQQTDVVQHPSGRKREQDTLIPTAAVSLSEQHLVKSLKAAAQNQRKKISWGGRFFFFLI